MDQELRELRVALLDLVGVINRPQPDAALIALAGVDLERALFPLLMGVELRGPLAIGELAEQCGRDYTTVSRQITRLEALGLVIRRAGPADARVREVVITDKGRQITGAIDAARERVMSQMFAAWDPAERTQLVRLMRRFADDAMAMAKRARRATKASAP